MVTPAMTAWDISRAWPTVDLQMMPGDGRVSPNVFAAFVAATNRFDAQADGPKPPRVHCWVGTAAGAGVS